VVVGAVACTGVFLEEAINMVVGTVIGAVVFYAGVDTRRQSSTRNLGVKMSFSTKL
jgi:hypothetical protein